MNKKLVVKFSNGNTLTIEESGGHKIYNLTKANMPKVSVVGHGYVFATNMVYRCIYEES